MILLQKNVDIHFSEAECIRIDAENKKVYCKSSQDTNLNGEEEFSVDYDYLVIAMGARANTFNTPGVVENCHFLKVTSVEIVLFNTSFSYKMLCFSRIIGYQNSSQLPQLEGQ